MIADNDVKIKIHNFSVEIMKYLIIFSILLLGLSQHCTAKKRKFAVIGGGNFYQIRLV